MMGFGFGMGVWGWLLMSIFWLVLIVTALWAARLLFPASDSRSQPDTPPPSAEDILKTRYARGEVSEEQYQRMLRSLRG